MANLMWSQPAAFLQRVYFATAACSSGSTRQLLRFSRFYSDTAAPAATSSHRVFDIPGDDDKSKPYEIRVAATSRPGSVAGFLLNALRQDREVKAIATGGAVYRMLRAAAIANHILREDSAYNGKVIAIRPVLQESSNFDKVAYQVDFHPKTIELPPLAGYKDLRMASRGNPRLYRLNLTRSLVDEGIVGVSGAGQLAGLRGLLHATELCMRLRKMMPTLFDTVIVPKLKTEENEDGSLLHLTHMLLIRCVPESGEAVPETGWSSPGNLTVHPQPLSEAELKQVAPEPDMKRSMFVEYVATSARWFAPGRSNSPRSPRPSSKTAADSHAPLVTPSNPLETTSESGAPTPTGTSTQEPVAVDSKPGPAATAM